MKTATITSIFFLISFLLYYSQCSYPILEARRVNVNYSINDQLVTVPFLSQASSTGINVVVSISSFAQAKKISVNTQQIKKTYFIVKISSLSAFSYLLVNTNYFFQIGEITTIYQSQGPMVFNQTTQSVIKIDKLTPIISRYGIIQPFISQVISDQNQQIKSTKLSYKYNEYQKYLIVSRTADITKIKISFLAYLKFGRQYASINVYNPIDIFNYQNSFDKIFIGTKYFTASKSKLNPYKIEWTSSLTANSNGVVTEPYLFRMKNDYCGGILNGLNSILQMNQCIGNCSATLFQLGNISICSDIINASANLLPLNYTTGSQKIVMKVSKINSQICEIYVQTEYELLCKKCNRTNHFTQTTGDSCVCQSGYFSTPDILSNPMCYPCQDNQCPFVINYTYQLKIDLEKAQEYIQYRITINKDFQNNFGPAYADSYNQLVFNLYINNVRTKIQLNWISGNELVLKASEFPYSQNYEILLQLQNYIVLSSYQNNYQYISPKKRFYQRYVKQSSPSGKFIKSSAEVITSVAPTAALISALCGSKINFLSFIQTSSIFYLSSYIKWLNYGSLKRVSLSQSLFKLTPSNYFSSFGLRPGFPKFYSIGQQQPNLMLQNNRNELYITLSIEYLLSTLAQIILIQTLIRILLILFPQSRQKNGYKINNQGQITWYKKSFLVQIAQQDTISFRQKVAGLVQKIKIKRFIFYNTFICSQIVFHSFMAFSQLKINCSCYQELANLIFSVLTLSIFTLYFTIGPHSPLVVLKSIAIIYKKRIYNQKQLIIYYAIGVMQLFVYGASVAIFQSCFHQCIGVSVLLIIKILIMRTKIKIIDLVKNILLLAFFGILCIGSYFSTQIKSKLQTSCIVLMMVISSIQLMKVIRSIIILILSFLKQTPSIKGQAFIEKIKQEMKKNN